MKFLAILVTLVMVATAYGAMPRCANPSAYENQQVCDRAGNYCGECVSLVKKCTGDGRATSAWRRGIPVKNNGHRIPSGTAIATFPNGRYSGHAAIYEGQDQRGIYVWDQWRTGRPKNVGRRLIAWNGRGISNNGDSFYVID